MPAASASAHCGSAQSPSPHVASARVANKWACAAAGMDSGLVSGAATSACWAASISRWARPGQHRPGAPGDASYIPGLNTGSSAVRSATHRASAQSLGSASPARRGGGAQPLVTTSTRVNGHATGLAAKCVQGCPGRQQKAVQRHLGAALQAGGPPALSQLLWQSVAALQEPRAPAAPPKTAGRSPRFAAQDRNRCGPPGAPPVQDRSSAWGRAGSRRRRPSGPARSGARLGCRRLRVPAGGRRGEVERPAWKAWKVSTERSCHQCALAKRSPAPHTAVQRHGAPKAYQTPAFGEVGKFVGPCAWHSREDAAERGCPRLDIWHGRCSQRTSPVQLPSPPPTCRSRRLATASKPRAGTSCWGAASAASKAGAPASASASWLSRSARRCASVPPTSSGSSCATSSISPSSAASSVKRNRSVASLAACATERGRLVRQPTEAAGFTSAHVHICTAPPHLHRRCQLRRRVSHSLHGGPQLATIRPRRFVCQSMPDRGNSLLQAGRWLPAGRQQLRHALPHKL